jgi:hypothetical protein
MQRRNGIIAFAALSCFLLCGATAPEGCPSGSQPIGPSSGEIVGVTVGVVAVVVFGTIAIVGINHSHHVIKGCVTAGPDGIELHTEDTHKIYALAGITANVKVGDIVKVNGSKNKHQKDSAGDEDFMVQKIGRDYGPCKAALAAQTAAATPAASTSAAPTPAP